MYTILIVNDRLTPRVSEISLSCSPPGVRFYMSINYQKLMHSGILAHQNNTID